jgi:selenocysteine-specific elongation factor
LSGSADEGLLAALRRVEPAPLAALAGEAGLSQDELFSVAEALVGEGRLVALGELSSRDTPLMTSEAFVALTERARSLAETYHQEHPLRRGVPREELRSRLRLEERIFAPALDRWLEAGQLIDTAASIALPGRSPELTAEQQAEADAYLAALAGSPYAPPTDRTPAADLLAYLEDAGQVVAVGEGVVFAAEAYREMVERITEHLRRDGTITLAQVRDMFGASRKYAQALLEHLDRHRVTRRVGDERVLRERPD